MVSSVLVIYFCKNVDTRYVVLYQNSSIDVIFYGLLVSFCHIFAVEKAFFVGVLLHDGLEQ